MGNGFYLDKPVFILGLHRTGSTLLNNMLNKHSKLAMTIDEMHVKTPWRIMTFSNYLRKEFPFDDARHFRIFLDNIFSGKIYGSFWNKYQPTIDEKNSIVEKYVQIDNATPKDVLTLILNQYRERTGKDRVGVKYPLHFKYTFLLKEWYPDGKLIFLVRDVRAICASKVNDEATKIRKQKFSILSPVIHYFTILGFIYDYYLSYLVVKKNRAELLLIRYEDLITDPIEVLSSICNYCEISYENDMITAIGKSSSYKINNEAGIDTSRIDKWKSHLNRFDQWLITLLSRKSLKYFGY